jgi:LPS-assembly protein
VSSLRGDEFVLSYRYDKGDYHFYQKDDTVEDIESIYGRLRLKLPFRFTVYGSNEYDLEENERIETTVGLVYEAQCWSLDVRYKDEDDDKEISFMFNLYGLGSIGLQ